MNITFITTNTYKFRILQKIGAEFGIDVVQSARETPEIQAFSPVEVAAFSAQWGAKQLGIPVVTVDFGVAIPALGGFPGPFVKYINAWLKPENVLKLLEHVEDRSAIYMKAYAFCAPGEGPITQEAHFPMTMATEVHPTDDPKYMFDRICIPEGSNKTVSEESRADRAARFDDSYRKFLHDIVLPNLSQ
jgi:non-canonical purine NTP pyrophosphatase (RdgB/HAM1 family)